MEQVKKNTKAIAKPISRRKKTPKKSFESLDKAKLAKTSLKVGLPLAATLAGVLFIRRAIKRRKNPDGTGTSAAPSLKEMKVKKSDLTISSSDAAVFANTLYGAMVNLGTKEKTIYSTIDKITTKSDMLLVIKAFGLKKYFLGDKAAFLGHNLNLIGWLRAELTTKELGKIKPRFESWGIPL